MILEQLEKARDFTGSEQMIAEYVLKYTDSPGTADSCGSGEESLYKQSHSHTALL